MKASTIVIPAKAGIQHTHHPTFSDKNIMKKIIIFLFLLALGLTIVSPALADDYGLKATAGAAGIKTEGSVAGTVGTITGYALSLIGILFFGLMLYGGFLWMTAKGDESQVKKALEIIIDAVIGLLIVGAAYIITSLVFSAMK